MGTDESPDEGSGAGDWEEGTDLNDVFQLELASPRDRLETESKKEELKESLMFPAWVIGR